MIIKAKIDRDILYCIDSKNNECDDTKCLRHVANISDKQTLYQATHCKNDKFLCPCYNKPSDICKVCGRKLKNPESIKRGMGNSCYKKYIKNKRGLLNK